MKNYFKIYSNISNLDFVSYYLDILTIYLNNRINLS